MTWQAVIFGPDDTPWEGGTFKLLLEFTEDYPNKVGEVLGRRQGLQARPQLRNAHIFLHAMTFAKYEEFPILFPSPFPSRALVAVKAPAVRFVTKMFHPNIYNDGQICLGKSSRGSEGGFCVWAESVRGVGRGQCGST